jgi:uncharacterized protein YndB with AHSA1/START domain
MFKWLFGKRDDEEGGASGGGGGGTQPEVISLSRQVKAPPDKAFAAFVDAFGTWWPQDRSISKDKLKAIRIEPRMGGRAIEERADGGTTVFGKVLAIDRPNHIVLAWQISADGVPVDEEAMASRLDVRFMPDASGGTNVLVVHRDFFRHGDGWQRYRADMAGKKGWPALIEAYVKTLGG